jgi:gliding motility-associated-like protein
MIFKKNSLFLILSCVLFYGAIGQSFSYVSNNFCFDNSIPVNTTSQLQTKNLIVTDLDNDNVKDVIVTKGGAGPPNISIYTFTNSTNSFVLRTTFTVDFGIATSFTKQYISYGKFNSDNNPDLIFVSDSCVYIYQNNGGFNFTFLTKKSFPTQYIGHEHYLKVADFNSDGKDDFCFASEKLNGGIDLLLYRQLSSNVYNLDNTYTIFQSYNLSSAGRLDINVADIEATSLPTNDVMFTLSSIKDSVFFLKNSSITTGSIISMTRIGTKVNPFNGGAPEGSEIADLDGDGKPDFIFYLGTATTNSICVIQGISSFTLNNLNLTFSTNGFKVRSFKMADVTGDGKLDYCAIGNYSLVTGNAFLGIYSGTGNSTYLNPLPTILTSISTTGLNADEMQIADLDGNSANDIVFKPRGIVDKTQMIPNFTFLPNTSPLNSYVCSSFQTTLTATIPSTISAQNWYSYPLGAQVSTLTSFVTNVSNQYYSLLSFKMYSANTCTVLSDTVIVADVSPTITVTSNKPKYCLNEPFVLNASGAPIINWYDGTNQVVSSIPIYSSTATNSTFYTAVGQNSLGCKASEIYSLNLYAKNNAGIIPSTSLICSGDLVTLSFFTAQSYTWSNGSNNSSITINPISNSTYTVSFIDFNSCRSDTSIEIIVNNNCENGDNYNAITPNNDGINDFLFIENIDKYKNIHVGIYNRWGQELYSNKYDNVNFYWPKKEDSNNIVSSTYFYVINYGNGTIKKGWLEVLIN